MGAPQAEWSDRVVTVGTDPTLVRRDRDHVGSRGLAALALVGNYAVVGAARMHVRCIARAFEPLGVRAPAPPADLSQVRMTWAGPDRAAAPVPVRSARP
jgi:hypothetical protein